MAETSSIPPTTQVRLMRELKNVPEQHRLSTLTLVAQCVAESAGKPIPDDGIPLTRALAVLGEYVPPGTIATPLPNQVRIAFNEVILSLGFAATTSSLETTAGTMVVETSTEKEARERTVSVGGIKFLKSVERPYTALYPHYWLGGGVSFIEWKTTWNDFAAPATKTPDHCRFKNRQLFLLMEQWFAGNQSTPPTVEACPSHVVRAFNCIVQMLLEIHLVSGVSLAGTATAATATFAALLEERAHGSQAINYFDDLKKACEAKEPRKLFR